MTSRAGATTRAMSLNGVSALDTDTTAKVAFDKIADGGGTQAIVGSRQSGTNGYRAIVTVAADGSTTLTLKRVGATPSTLKTAVPLPGVTLTPGAQLQIRLQTQGTSSTVLRARAWLVGTTEPSTWQATATDSTAAVLQGPGGAYLSTYVSSGTNLPVVARWDDLLVNSL